jgi:hypothetical protein
VRISGFSACFSNIVCNIQGLPSAIFARSCVFSRDSDSPKTWTKYCCISVSERGANLITIALDRIVGRIQLSCSAVAKRYLLGSGSSQVFRKAFIAAFVIL